MLLLRNLILVFLFTCFPFSVKSFIHPGTTINPNFYHKLRTIPSSTNPTMKRCYNDLMNFAKNDINIKSNARREVRVVYNPTEWDLAEMPPSTRQKLIKARDENERLIKIGSIAGHEQFTGDSIRIYKHTLAFLITNQPRYGHKAAQLLNSWATRCKVFGYKEQNGPLEAGWGLVNMAQSAELLKYTFRGWNSSIENNFVRFVDTLLMPNLRYFDRNGILTNFPMRSNWGTTIVQARLQYAIFRNNQNEYDYCIRNVKILMDHIFTRTGRTSETLRDIIHAQYGLAGISGISELFWYQKKNVYRRVLATAYEYHAAILLGNIPQELKGKTLHWASWIPANWVMSQQAFKVRFKINMPNSTQLINKQLYEDYDKHWGFGTITQFF
jgi:hypothetical protein